MYLSIFPSAMQAVLGQECLLCHHTTMKNTKPILGLRDGQNIITAFASASIFSGEHWSKRK